MRPDFEAGDLFAGARDLDLAKEKREAGRRTLNTSFLTPDETSGVPFLFL
jgi:hypothetical protein